MVFLFPLPQLPSPSLTAKEITKTRCLSDQEVMADLQANDAQALDLLFQRYSLWRAWMIAVPMQPEPPVTTATSPESLAFSPQAHFPTFAA
jgi:hypothetical protein